MGDVIKGAFGVGAAAQSAGEPGPALPPPQKLAAQLDETLGHLRHATTRLTNLVPPGGANEERLQGLYQTHVTIQDNLADVAGRLQGAVGDENLDEGAYMGIANDLVEVQQQTQSYVESVEKLIGESAASETALAPAAGPRMQPNWMLIGALGLSLAGVGFGLWQWRKSRKR